MAASDRMSPAGSRADGGHSCRPFDKWRRLAHTDCRVKRRQPQQSDPACIGGQGTLPYEQKTQQSPGRGLRTAPQDGQSWKYRQASVGIVSSVDCPQAGQVSTEVSVKPV